MSDNDCMGARRGIRNVGVITVARSDYGIYLPLLERIAQDDDLSLQLFVTGMHLLPDCGLTVRQIEQDGFPIAARVPMPMVDDTPQSIARASGSVTAGLAPAYAQHCPDILLALGDRFEMHAAVTAAVPFNIPIAHLHGGETTEWATDDVLRHSMTKLCHLHFAATQLYADRIIKMGEDPKRVYVIGALGLDNLRRVQWLDRDDLAKRFGAIPAGAFLLVTYHPVTRMGSENELHVRQLMAALERAGRPVIFTYPNVDAGNRAIIETIEQFAATRSDARVVASLGTDAYFSLMRFVSAMVGNSSSGIIEAASLGLPVGNFGPRQQGRLRGANVIDVDADANQIVAGIERALSPSFGKASAGMINPYGDGQAAPRIVNALKRVELGSTLIAKRFLDKAG